MIDDVKFNKDCSIKILFYICLIVRCLLLFIFIGSKSRSFCDWYISKCDDRSVIPIVLFHAFKVKTLNWEIEANQFIV